MYFRAFLLLSIIAVLGSANTLQGTIDVKRLEGILQENLKSKDISSLYYAVKGLKQLNAKIPNICEDLKTIKYDLKNIEQVFYLTNAAALSGCQNSLKPEVLTAPAQTLDKKDVTIPELYYAVYSLKALGKGSIYDKEDGLKNLIQLLKKDDSPANYGYVFGLCEHMGCTTWNTQHAEGVLLAADESDAKALHFEGGLPVTSLVLSTIFRTYKSLSKPSPLTEEQRLKFGAYLLSRRSVNTPRGAALLLEAAAALADDQSSPISITVKGKKYISAESDSIEVSITDLLGRGVRGLQPDKVLAQSGTRLADDVVVLSKQPLTQKPNDPTTFVLNLSKIKAQYGLYKVLVSAGGRAGSVTVAVLGELRVRGAELGVGDVDGTLSPKLTTLAYPDQLKEPLHADHMQKLTLKVTVKDKYDKPVLVQQAFLRVAPAAGDAAGDSSDDTEAIFVAEPDNTKAYKVELNVGSIAKHLQQSSGLYSLRLLVGDSAAAAPVAWQLGHVHFNFAHDKPTPAPAHAVRGPLPEIKHQFRSAEPRPPRLLSDVFAAACAAPLLLLLTLWARLRVNLANMPLAPSMLLFHLGLGGSLALYGVLWLQLTMFETVRYLLPLAGLTFLAGHRLLRRLANKH